MDRTVVKVGLKYCGGCNPTFDRVALVMDLVASLDVAVQWVSYEDKDILRLFIVNGCEMACVEPKEFEDKRLKIFSVCGDELGVKEGFLSFIKGGNLHD
jgi:hypothetical protein